MRKLLMIIPIYVASMALPGIGNTFAVSVGKASGSVARVGTVKACQRSHLSFNHGGQVSELLIQEGQGREVRVNSSRESGK
ncbi:hypothetical protein [Pseudomonas farris]